MMDPRISRTLSRMGLVMLALGMSTLLERNFHFAERFSAAVWPEANAQGVKIRASVDEPIYVNAACAPCDHSDCGHWFKTENVAITVGGVVLGVAAAIWSVFAGLALIEKQKHLKACPRLGDQR